MNKSYEEYRKLHLELTNWFIILIIIAQAIMLFVLKMVGADINVKDYLIKHIVITAIINFISVAIAYKIHKSRKFKDTTKNIVYLLTASVIVLGVAITENTTSASLCVLIIPIFLATGFGSNFYLNLTTVIAYIGLIITGFTGVRMTAYESDEVYRLVSYIECSLVIILVRVIASVIKDFCLSSASKIENHENATQNLEAELLRDRMTGLYNHASFYGFLQKITKENGTDMGDVTLAIIDIDNFKKVNDTYGHSKGDEVIIYLSDVLKKHFTDIGYVCRYGGEEFAVIFVNKKGKEAKRLMEAALEEFRNHTFSWKEEPVTFSCGICEYMSGMMTDKELFGIADKVLYRAKNSGKNQCLL